MSVRPVLLAVLVLSALCACVDAGEAALGKAELDAAIVTLAKRDDPELRLRVAEQLVEDLRYADALAVLPGPSPSTPLRWVEAVALIRSDRYDEALARLRDVRDEPSPYGSAAARVIEGLGVPEALTAFSLFRGRLLARLTASPDDALVVRIHADGAEVALRERGDGSLRIDAVRPGRTFTWVGDSTGQRGWSEDGQGVRIDTSGYGDIGVILSRISGGRIEFACALGTCSTPPVRRLARFRDDEEGYLEVGRILAWHQEPDGSWKGDRVQARHVLIPMIEIAADCSSLVVHHEDGVVVTIACEAWPRIDAPNMPPAIEPAQRGIEAAWVGLALPRVADIASAPRLVRLVAAMLVRSVYFHERGLDDHPDIDIPLPTDAPRLWLERYCLATRERRRDLVDRIPAGAQFDAVRTLLSSSPDADVIARSELAGFEPLCHGLGAWPDPSWRDLFHFITERNSDTSTTLFAITAGSVPADPIARLRLWRAELAADASPFVQLARQRLDAVLAVADEAQRLERFVGDRPSFEDLLRGAPDGVVP